MRVALLCWTASVLLGCAAGGIRSYDCPYPAGDFEQAVAVFVDVYPAATPVLNRTDVFCIDVKKEAGWVRPYGDKVSGETLWPGNELTRARIRVATGSLYPTVATGATVHEFFHLYLWDTTGDSCYNHSQTCGWDYTAIATIQGCL